MWSRRNQFSRVSPGVFALLLLQRAAAHEQRSVSLSLIVSGVTRLYYYTLTFHVHTYHLVR